ncbi:hypothetical protein GH714_000489 [Hevea brasiliensis]|uniref:Uncharacterized protein n=1 Tax=Hevea brasiliensis TaxID=3981 RepID=A0A6A6LR90_HEVBR|nr:hypothetical protein GH714_000489 [Hevea brasiliensis]
MACVGIDKKSIGGGVGGGRVEKRENQLGNGKRLIWVAEGVGSQAVKGSSFFTKTSVGSMEWVLLGQLALLAVARKSGVIEVLNPLNGEIDVSISSVGDAGTHLRTMLLLVMHFACMYNKGMQACGPLKLPVRLYDASTCTSRTWKVSASGNILCSKVDGSENYALFGGKAVEVNLWDLEKCSKIWTAKPVRLYDTSAQRRPVISFDFCETPIKAVTESRWPYNLYRNGSGDLASVDIRTAMSRILTQLHASIEQLLEDYPNFYSNDSTLESTLIISYVVHCNSIFVGKLLGCFLGKCSGSIRSIAKHPELPVIGSCVLIAICACGYKTRQLLSAFSIEHCFNDPLKASIAMLGIFLRLIHLWLRFPQAHLTNNVFDSNFTDREVTVQAQNVNEIQKENEMGTVPAKRKKASKEKQGKKKASKENDGSKRVKSKDKS